MASLTTAARESSSTLSLSRPPRETDGSEGHTYGQILKSSALIGGSSVVNIIFGIVRTKVMAVFVGPTGVGLMGLYTSIADVTQSLAGLGIQSSGVRQIAEAAGSGESERLASTATVLRRISILLGIAGAALIFVFAAPISRVTFGGHDQAAGVALLSLAVLFRIVAAGQGALIQGMRRVADLASMSVVSAVLGTALTIPLIYFFRMQGVVPSLVAVAAVSLVASWWYSRRVQPYRSSITMSEAGAISAGLLKLGLAFMASGLLVMGSAYAVRIIVLHKVGFEATGLYQSAWTLAGLYVGVILQAMGADFYPRLTAKANDNVACNRLVNEQTRVGLLLGAPGTLATLTLAPIVVALFYTQRFEGAVDLLRWICLGVALRVITWPLGFIILAKGKRSLFFWSELAWAIVNVGLTWIGVSAFGLNGAGMAFFVSYVFHGVVVYSIVRQLSGFRWSRENSTSILVFLSLSSAVFCGIHFLPRMWSLCLGTLIATGSGLHSIRHLLALISSDAIPPTIRRALALR